jgi:hypothetical protein
VRFCRWLGSFLHVLLIVLHRWRGRHNAMLLVLQPGTSPP